jgi:short-subunit dehydrogenase
MPVCVILGAGPGVSQSVAKAFLSRGFHVALCARDQQKLGKLATALGRNTSKWALDVSNFAILKNTLQEITSKQGEIEVVIFNAFSLAPGKSLDVDLEKFHDSLKVNVSSALAAAQAVTPSMIKNGRGSILFTGGGFALQPFSDLAALSVGKAGLRALAHCLFNELKSKGVHAGTVTICGTVQPGSAFDPDVIAGEFLRLHDQPVGSFEPEIIFTGANDASLTDTSKTDAQSFPYKSLVSFRFKVPVTDEIKALIPAEKARIAQLRDQNVVTQVFLAKDGTHGWLALQGQDRNTLLEQLQTLPMHDYLHFEFDELS